MSRQSRRLKGPTAAQVKGFIESRGLTTLDIGNLLAYNERYIQKLCSGESECPWAVWWMMLQRVDDVDIDEPWTDIIREKVLQGGAV